MIDKSGPTASPEKAGIWRPLEEEDKKPIPIEGCKLTCDSKVSPLEAPSMSDKAIWSVQGRLSLVINEGYDIVSGQRV